MLDGLLPAVMLRQREHGEQITARRAHPQQRSLHSKPTPRIVLLRRLDRPPGSRSNLHDHAIGPIANVASDLRLYPVVIISGLAANNRLLRLLARMDRFGAAEIAA